MTPGRPRLTFLILVAAALLPAAAHAQADSLVRAYTAEECGSCERWSTPHEPARLFAGTYLVGTAGLGSVLITSPEGHVLIDGGLPNSAPLILANIRALGFDPREVRLIVNSHSHYDHAGGIAALQQATGARVAASPSSARVLMDGRTGPDDPQYAIALPYPAASNVETLRDGQTLRVGSTAITAHFTPGHTPGGTSWTWRACEGDRCLDFVYADSWSPISADGFRFSDSREYPDAVAGFRRFHAWLESVRCDVLVTPHPSPALWERAAAGPERLADREACRRYAAEGRRRLEARLREEAGAR